jgi:hypothetical protein
MLSIGYGDLVPVLAGAIQALNRRIDELERAN